MIVEKNHRKQYELGDIPHLFGETSFSETLLWIASFPRVMKTFETVAFDQNFRLQNMQDNYARA